MAWGGAGKGGGLRLLFQSHALRPFSPWIAAVGGAGVARAVVNCGLLPGADPSLREALEERLRKFARRCRSPWFLRLPLPLVDPLRPLIRSLRRVGLDGLVVVPDLPGTGGAVATALPDLGEEDGFEGWVELRHEEELPLLEHAPGWGVILVGRDAALATSTSSAGSLYCRLRQSLASRPVLVRGGLGPVSARALVTAGASGVVFEGEFVRRPESGLSPACREGLARLRPRSHRVVARGASCLQLPLAGGGDDGARARAVLEDLHRAFRNGLVHGDEPDAGLEAMAVGREACLDDGVWRGAATPDGVTRLVLDGLATLGSGLAKRWPFRRGAPLARLLGVELPVVQGPMAWISDRPAFARAVHAGGAFPVLALGGRPGPDCAALLRGEEGALPPRFGVGLIGFEGAETFEGQLRAMEERPPVMAVLAGATEGQCRRVAPTGVRPFAHAPAPEIFSLFHEAGRDVVLEGWESGGHVGALSSLMLWESCLATLPGDGAGREPVEEPGRESVAPDVTPSASPDEGTDVERGATRALLLAGGISCPASALLAAVFARGFEDHGYGATGLQLGTAYLATDEAVASEAITPVYRDLVRRGLPTHVIGAELGHAVRLLEAPLTTRLLAVEDEVRREGGGKKVLAERMRSRLEGRLRLAARGIVDEEGRPRAASAARQLEEAGFMAGDVCRDPNLPATVAELHRRLVEVPPWLGQDSGPIPIGPARDGSVVDGGSGKGGRLFVCGASSREELVRAVSVLRDAAAAGDGETVHRLRKEGLARFRPRPHRAMVLAANDEELARRAAELVASLAGEESRVAAHWGHRHGAATTRLVVLHPGQGASHPGMLDEAAATGLHLRALREEERRAWLEEGIDPFAHGAAGTSLSVQARLVAVERCLVRWFASFGVRVDAWGGHSLGELVALDGAAVWPRRRTARIVAARGRAMDERPCDGGLTAIRAASEDVETWIRLLGESLHVVNLNGPEQTVVAGSLDALALFERLLASHGVGARRLDVTHPFHGPAMGPAARAFGRALETILRPEDVEGGREARARWDRVWSNLTARSYGSHLAPWRDEAPEATRAEAWRLVTIMLRRHVEQPVRFQAMAEDMLGKADALVLEMGPGRTLSGLLRSMRRREEILLVPTLLPGKERESLERAVAVAVLCGRVEGLDGLLLDEGELGSSSAPAGIDGGEPKPPESPAPPVWARSPGPALPPPAEDDVAVVAMAIETAGADGLDPFWKLLVEGRDVAAPVPESKWDGALFTDPDPEARDRAYTDVAAVARFDTGDPIRFQVQPKAAAFVDRMQLVSLKLAERLIGQLGWDRRSFPHHDAMAVLGYGVNEAFIGRYAGRLVLEHQKAEIRRRIRSGELEGTPVEGFFEDWLADQDEDLPHFETIGVVGTLANMVTARVARWLDLDRPNFVVDSACSSSLAAIDVAAMALRAGRCRWAISGGMDDFSLGRQIGFSKAHALSKKGRCTPFDASADGLVQGDGAALFLLTTVGLARSEGLPIRAVLRGIGGSSDGRRSSGITVPSVERQSTSVRRCLLDAGWDPVHVDYVEAHGTGTPIGDPAEFRTFDEIFAGVGHELLVGSVKGNVGHTMVASGAVSLAKVILAFERGTLPPTANLETLQPGLLGQGSPARPLRRSHPFFRRDGATPRRALVCANGFGGTNYHLAVEEWSPPSPEAAGRDALLCLASPDARELLARLDDLRRAVPGAEPRRLAARWSGQGGVGHGAWRVSILADGDGRALPDGAACRALVEGLAPGRELHRLGPMLFSRTAGPVRPALLFPGFGSVSVDSGREMSRRCPAFAEVLDMRLRLPDPFVDRIRAAWEGGRSLLLEPAGEGAGKEERLVSAIFAVSTCDLAWLRCVDLLGLRPRAVAGYSLGELVALYAAAMLDGEDFTLLEKDVLRRLGRLAATWEGWMSTVVLPDGELDELLGPAQGRVAVAMRVAPGLNVVTGLGASMADFEKRARARGATLRPLDGAGAFHLGLGGDEIPPLDGETRRRLELSPARFPAYSSVDAVDYGRLSDGEAVLAHFRGVAHRPMDMGAQIRALWAEGANLFLEVGAGGTYAHMARSALEGREATCLSMSTRGRHDEWQAFRLAVADLHGAGLALRGEAFGHLGLIPGRDPGKGRAMARPRHGGDPRRGEETMDDERMRALERVLQMNRELVERGLEANARALGALYGDGQEPDGAAAPSPGSAPAMSREGASRPEPPRRDPVPAAASPSVPTATAGDTGTAPPPQAPSRGSSPAVKAGPAVDPDLRRQVLSVIERHTGYGESHLVDDARLDEDLAIDSIQQLLILNDIAKLLGKELDADMALETERGPETIGELLALVQVIGASE